MAGHSYGSICGNAIATHHPEDIDAFIYTGYSGDFIGGLGPLSAGVASKLDNQQLSTIQSASLTWYYSSRRPCNAPTIWLSGSPAFIPSSIG
jgi:hypothetical protein